MERRMTTNTMVAAPNATPEEKKARNDDACSTAETFVGLYYERLDSKRHLVGKFCSFNHNDNEPKVTMKPTFQDSWMVSRVKS